MTNIAALLKLAKNDKAAAALLATALGIAVPKGPQKKAKGKTVRAKSEPDPDRKAAFSAAVVKAGEKAGFTNVIPNETMLTYGKWEERGFTVKKGQKAIRVKTAGMNGKGIPLFHKDQVEAIGSEDKAPTVAEEALASPDVH
jgi:hypothetical protein